MATTLARRPIFVRPSAPRPIVIKTPSFPKKLKHAARRVGGAVAEEKHRIGAIGAGFILGLVDKSGIDLPTIPMLGKAGTLGAFCWAAGKWGKSRMASHAATGLLAIAAYELGKEGHISGPEYVSGM
jgi:hypothetical protein